MYREFYNEVGRPRSPRNDSFDCPLFEADDFGAELTPELRAQEERLRSEIERGANKPR